MISNTWDRDAIIRAYERDLSIKQIQEHFHVSNFSLEDIREVVGSKYPLQLRIEEFE